MLLFKFFLISAHVCLFSLGISQPDRNLGRDRSQIPKVERGLFTSKLVVKQQ